MLKKKVEGTTENLNLLTNKVKYIGFELEKIPEFLNEFEPLNYRVPKVYDEKTYKIYKYIDVDNIEILITPKDRLSELSERYKLASPIYTYMQSGDKENLEKYAYFLRMINQTNLADIQRIEEEQEEFNKQIPFEVKFQNNFKWQIFYSDYAKKYFMLASTEESDNAPMFYLLKQKIEQNNKKDTRKIFVPISNEEYTEKILKKSEIEDLINYLWYFTKNWASIYEVTDKDENLSIHIVGETQIYDKMTSKYKIIINDKKEAQTTYKLIKALFILSYDLSSEYKFNLKVGKEGDLEFYFNGEKIEYTKLPEFLRSEAIRKMKENEELKIENQQIKADIKDLQRLEEIKEKEYLNKQKQIANFMECKKTFIGKLKYFFKGKKQEEKEEEGIIEKSVNKNRLKDILNQDKTKDEHLSNEEIEKQNYTIEDIIKIGKQLAENAKINKNANLDKDALEAKINRVNQKIKSADMYLTEINDHKRSIFDFWKYANKDESKMLVEGQEIEETKQEKIKRKFDYEEDIETLAANIDVRQREKLSHKEQDAIFASNFILDGINIVSKKELLKADEEKIKKLLETLKDEYRKDIDKIEVKDFDIFGNVAEDKTKIKTLKNNKHRENEKDKFKVLNVNLDTQLEDFIQKIKDIRKTLVEESSKIEVPCNLSLYKAANDKIEPTGFDKFSINPYETLNKLEQISTSKETYLYKINVPEGTKLMFYSNITFFENDNKTLPLGMDISQESLIDMEQYDLELKGKDEFNINIEKEGFKHFVKNVKVYEYNLKKK